MADVKEILNTRGKEYGDRFINLECIAELKEVFHRYETGNAKAREGLTGTQYRAYLHCMEMALVKIARICTGVFKDDNFDDAIGYISPDRDWETL